MPYIVASIIAIVAALTILLTKYEADDSTIKAELANMKVMFSMVDGFVNTYVDSGGDLTVINFEVLADDNILFNVGTTDNSTRITPTAGNAFETTMRLPSNEVVWHLIPNPTTTNSYKLLVDMTGSSGLMSKAIFSESFSGREFCEKMLFGTFEEDGIAYNTTTLDFDDQANTNNNGIFVCTVFK